MIQVCQINAVSLSVVFLVLGIRMFFESNSQYESNLNALTLLYKSSEEDSLINH